MKMKTFVALLFFTVCCVPFCAGTRSTLKDTLLKRYKSDKVMDVADFSIYYDIQTNETIRKMLPRPWYKPGWFLRLPFTGGKCDCDGLLCTCCTGIRIQAFNFDRRTCTVLQYEPADSMINMEIIMNNDTVFRNSYSARNPPPFCIPVPVPYLPPGLVDMCVRLFDITVVGQRLHVCMDMDTRVDMAPILILHFDCMDMGLDGVGLSKPGMNNHNNVSNVTSDASADGAGQLDSDVYDPVTEDTKMTTEESPFYNSIRYIK